MLTRDSGSRRKEKRAAAVARARSGARDASNRLKDVRSSLKSEPESPARKHWTKF